MDVLNNGHSSNCFCRYIYSSSSRCRPKSMGSRDSKNGSHGRAATTAAVGTTAAAAAVLQQQQQQQRGKESDEGNKNTSHRRGGKSGGSKSSSNNDTAAAAPASSSYSIMNNTFRVDSRYSGLKAIGKGSFGFVCSGLDEKQV